MCCIIGTGRSKQETPTHFKGRPLVSEGDRPLKSEMAGGGLGGVEGRVSSQITLEIRAGGIGQWVGPS